MTTFVLEGFTGYDLVYSGSFKVSGSEERIIRINQEEILWLTL